MPRKIPRKRKECVAFGKTVRRYRKLAGYSQEALAPQAKIHRTYIGGIERGERNSTLMMIHRLANVLGVTPNKLLETDEPQSARHRT
jgi:transcriptional regulator with XRE-family HTH domain